MNSKRRRPGPPDTTVRPGGVADLDVGDVPVPVLPGRYEVEDQPVEVEAEVGDAPEIRSRTKLLAPSQPTR